MANGEERETIVNFNEAENTASIYTNNRRWKNRLAKMGYEPTEDDGEGGLTFEVPKSVIQLPVARKSREYTDEEREAIAERLAKARTDRDKKRKGKKGKGTAKPKPKAKAKKSKSKAEPEPEDDTTTASSTTSSDTGTETGTGTDDFDLDDSDVQVEKPDNII